jgi:pseudouridine kinase
LKHPSDKPRALVVGGAGQDILAVAAIESIPGDSTPGTVMTSSGGVARNLAENLIRLDVQTTLVSAVGDDAAGRHLLTEAGALGIDTRAMLTVAGERTASYAAFVDHTGETLQAVSDMQIFDKLTIDDFSQFKNCTANAGCCVLDTNLPDALIVDVAHRCHKLPLICEAVSRSKCRKLLPVLDDIALLKVNRDEARQLLDNAASDTAPSALVNRLLERGVGAVLMSLGEAGIVYGDRERLIERRSHVVDVVSVNGAGDALLAAVLAARLHGEPLEGQLQWGLRAAALTCTSPSAVSGDITRDKLMR